MKSIILGLIVSMSSAALADTSATTNGYCEAKAMEYVQLLNDKVLKEIGAIQGYEESIDVAVTQTKESEDAYYKTYTETYTVSISANNDEGDWWMSEYVITMLAALNPETNKVAICDIRSLDYKGVVDSGNPYEED